MTDIVERLVELCKEAADEFERLRKDKIAWQNVAAGYHDEIERLRAALQEIADLSSVSVRAPHIARRALEPKP